MKGNSRVSSAQLCGVTLQDECRAPNLRSHESGPVSVPEPESKTELASSSLSSLALLTVVCGSAVELISPVSDELLALDEHPSI